MSIILAPAITASARPLASGTSVSGFVFYDLNSNGQWDAGEPKAPNTPVSWAVQAAGAKSLSVHADGNGNYNIDLSGEPTDPAHPYGLNARGLNSVGSALKTTYVVAEGGMSIFIPPGHAQTVNIALHFVGLNCTAPCSPAGYYPQTRFLVESVFQGYFDRRGGVSTFGYPISRPATAIFRCCLASI